MLGFTLAFILAGVFVGPWSVTPTPYEEDPQVLAIAAHEVLATECQESPAPPPQEEEDEDLAFGLVPPHPRTFFNYPDILCSHDALGPPLHCPDVETPPPRA